jgi:hypothetical protein
MWRRTEQSAISASAQMRSVAASALLRVTNGVRWLREPVALAEVGANALNSTSLQLRTASSIIRQISFRSWNVRKRTYGPADRPLHLAPAVITSHPRIVAQATRACEAPGLPSPRRRPARTAITAPG